MHHRMPNELPRVDMDMYTATNLTRVVMSPKEQLPDAVSLHLSCAVRGPVDE